MVVVAIGALVMVPVTVVTALRMRATDRRMAQELDRRINAL